MTAPDAQTLRLQAMIDKVTSWNRRFEGYHGVYSEYGPEAAEMGNDRRIQREAAAKVSKAVQVGVAGRLSYAQVVSGSALTAYTESRRIDLEEIKTVMSILSPTPKL